MRCHPLFPRMPLNTTEQPTTHYFYRQAWKLVYAVITIFSDEIRIRFTLSTLSSIPNHLRYDSQRWEFFLLLQATYIKTEVNFFFSGNVKIRTNTMSLDKNTSISGVSDYFKDLGLTEVAQIFQGIFLYAWYVKDKFYLYINSNKKVEN